MDANCTKRISERVIGCAYAVGNELGPGFLEGVYEKALCIELAKDGFLVERQKELNVTYKGKVVGKYLANIRGYLRPFAVSFY